MANDIHKPSEKIEASLYAVIGDQGHVRYDSTEELAEQIKLSLARVRIYVQTLAIEETDDRDAQFDETLLADEWYDASDTDDNEGAQEFAERIWTEAETALEAM